MPWFAKQKLTATAAPVPLQNFGGGIAITYDTVGADGYIAVIGRSAATMPEEAGTAYVFTKPAGAWNEACNLYASDPHGNDSFGFAVVADGNGAAANTIVVGAPTHSSTGMLPSDFTGAVYVFLYVGGLWTFSQKLVASDASAGALFGRSLAFNGVELFVGADGAGGNGAVYAFERPWGGGPFVEVQKLVASDAAAGDRFGSSITNKNNLIIGAYGCDAGAGALYYFHRPVWPGPWLEAQILVASDGAPNDLLGAFYGLDDASDIIIAGAQGAAGYTGAAYIFRSLGGSPLTWIEEQKLVDSAPLANSSFGASVAFYGGGDNPTAFVGTFNDGAGGKSNAVHRYTYNAGDGWTHSRTFTAAPPDPGAYFGCPVALSVPWSGPTIEMLIGAQVSSNVGAVYSFAQEARGLVYHFERDGGGVWNEIETIAPSDGYDNDRFGKEIAVDGPLLISGAATSTYPFSANDAPTVTDKVPAPWAINQPLISPISFKLTDADGDLSEFWTEIYVGGVDIYNHETAAPGWTVIRTPIANGFQYDVTGPAFSYGDIISVEVYGEDIFGASVDESWSFATPPLVPLPLPPPWWPPGWPWPPPPWPPGFPPPWWPPWWPWPPLPPWPWPWSSVGVETIVVVAKNVILINFSGNVVSNNDLFNPDNYSVSSLLGGNNGIVKYVYPTYSRKTTSIFLQVEQLVKGGQYRFTTRGGALRDENGFYILWGSVNWTMHRTKVDMVISTLANMYGTNVGSNIRSVIEAIMISDEKLGGDY